MVNSELFFLPGAHSLVREKAGHGWVVTLATGGCEHGQGVIWFSLGSDRTSLWGGILSLVLEEWGSPSWNGDAGRRDSFGKDPGTGMDGELQKAGGLNQVQNLRAHGLSKRLEGFNRAETLAYFPAVVRGKGGFSA